MADITITGADAVLVEFKSPKAKKVTRAKITFDAGDHIDELSKVFAQAQNTFSDVSDKKGGFGVHEIGASTRLNSMNIELDARKWTKVIVAGRPKLKLKPATADKPPAATFEAWFDLPESEGDWSFLTGLKGADAKLSIETCQTDLED